MQHRVVVGVPSLSSGDAVSNDVVGMYKALASRGVDVCVFPSDYASSLGMKMIHPGDVKNFLVDPRDIYIYHFCGYWAAGEELLEALDCRKIIKYHNVTPPEFFAGINADYEKTCKLGREAISRIAEVADIVWADSAYNADEFIAAGFEAKKTEVIPPFHHTAELLGTRPDEEWLDRLQDGKRNILVVGRLAPNKNHRLLIEAFAVLIKQIPGARLVIAGGQDDRLQSYNDRIDRLIDSLGLGESVIRTGKIAAEGLAAAYRSASVFAITSLHEGFCVPLVEAMAFGLPVVALPTCAVPETLGNAGMLVTEATAEAVSNALAEALQVSTGSNKLRRAQQSRYQSFFSQASIEGRFAAAIAPLLATERFKTSAIHQFHSGSALGDAVTNAMLFTQQMLRELGFASEIFVQYVAPELKEKIRHFDEWHPTADDMLLLHHSMGHDLDEWVMNLPSRNVLVYHNITPAEFFPENSPFRIYAKKGRQQLRQFAKYVQAAIAVSPFNAAELRQYGYKDLEVIPLLFDVAQIADHPWDDALVQREASKFTVLFVGRISPNKCQHELVAVASWMKRFFTRPFQLVFVGGYDAGSPYYGTVVAEIEAHGLEEFVRLTGKVSADELYAWYRTADVFLSLSEHEGFGVPLIEAMVFNVPVVAYKSSNIAETLGGAGLLLSAKPPAEVAGLMKVLSEDRALGRVLVEGQRARLTEFSRPRLRSQLVNFLKRQGVDFSDPGNHDGGAESSRLRYQIEGPVETSYSLALVNRELAFALDRFEPGCVGVFPTEGPGDYVPAPESIESVPGLKALYDRGRKGSQADVVIRNLYPPRVSDMDGQINILNYAWEESGFPLNWVEAFNDNLDAVTVTSRYVRKVMIDNGVRIPIAVVGNGVDHIAKIERENYPGNLGEGFRFLHISSCFPRKGVDVLLNAYATAFTASDDVTLIIKTFSNPHNEVASHIKTLQDTHPNCPAIVMIEDDLPRGQIADIYQRCNALVAPSRGEGFGLPMAEAMCYGLPVVTTAYGGQSDFCTDDTAWLVDFSFAPAQTHLGLNDSAWVEPDLEDLAQKMREVRRSTKSESLIRCEAARTVIERDFTWDRCAQRLRETERRVVMVPPLSRDRIRLGWISSWNSKCGIATYSGFLLNQFDSQKFQANIFASKTEVLLGNDEENVTRCWTDQFGEIDELLLSLKEANLQAIVLQHNFAFMSVQNLARLVDFSDQQSIPLIIQFHATKDVKLGSGTVSLHSIATSLKKASRILVHGVEDLNRLKQWGLIENVALFPHGVLSYTPSKGGAVCSAINVPADAKVVATYGFMLPHKGLEELLRAFPKIIEKLPSAHLVMVNAIHPDSSSAETFDRCRNLIEELGLKEQVSLHTEFLKDHESLELLSQAALIVFPYQNTAESASGAVRYGLASRRPVVCSPLSIFDDVRDVVHFLSGISEQEIAAGITTLLTNDVLLNSKAKGQDNWLECRAWKNIGARLAGMVSSVAIANRNLA